MAKLKIEMLQEQWDDTIAKAEKRGQGFFGDLKEFNKLTELSNALGLNRTMSIVDLTNALQVLENITIGSESKPDISFGEYLKTKKNLTLSSFGIPKKPENELAKFRIPENSPFHQFIIINHQVLLGYYELANSHAQGKAPVSEVDYSEDQLNESQAFLDMETTSLGSKSSDNTTVVSDLVRGGVKLRGIVQEGKLLEGTGAVILPSEVSDKHDPTVLKLIEGFTEDSANKENSRASKILYFGGQTLDAMMLHEFKNTTMLSDERLHGLEAGITKSQIDWYKDQDTNEYYAAVNTKILACSSHDGRQFVMGSDGISLIEPTGEEMDKPLNSAQAECRGDTSGNVTPICEMNAKVKLASGENGYFMKVENFNIKYNTPDLVSNKQFDVDPSYSTGPSPSG